ncbi:hypothetical protein GCM10009733_005010 [Nonomuraea maheshkhaliensis]|uniref:Uncharacterized protein n=1 Tax=Nonomuraea maheshkhaliensis TaxID=419590 RepID=A0ABN2EQ83_9ACTN
MAIEEYHGLHAEPPERGSEKIVWYPVTARHPSVRVKAHTCEAEPVVYELCAAGGLMHIRRTDRRGKEVVVTETNWVKAAEALKMWGVLVQDDPL